MFNPDMCREWAKLASDEFIQSDIPLKSSVAKISGNNDLNPTQIQRIVELANQLTYLRLFKQAEDKTFTFPVCQLSEVLEELKNHEQIQKSESFSPTPNIVRNLDLSKLQSIFGETETSPIPEMEHKKRVVIILEKMASAKDELSEQLIVAEANTARYLKDMKTVVKQLLLDGYCKEDLLGAMLLSFPEKKIELVTMFGDILLELSEEGMKIASWEQLKIASASEEACESLISDNLSRMGVRVINGQHPLYLVVKDFFSKMDEKDSIESGYQFIARKIEELKSGTSNDSKIK